MVCLGKCSTSVLYCGILNSFPDINQTGWLMESFNFPESHGLLVLSITEEELLKSIQYNNIVHLCVVLFQFYYDFIYIFQNHCIMCFTWDFYVFLKN